MRLAVWQTLSAGVFRVNPAAGRHSAVGESLPKREVRSAARQPEQGLSILRPLLSPRCSCSTIRRPIFQYVAVMAALTERAEFRQACSSKPTTRDTNSGSALSSTAGFLDIMNRTVSFWKKAGPHDYRHILRRELRRGRFCLGIDSIFFQCLLLDRATGCKQRKEGVMDITAIDG